MESETSGLVIDWRLLLLQAGNFLLLLAVLTWLLWKPLVKMLEERRRTIAEGLEAAEANKAAAARAEEERAKLLAAARTETTAMLAEARAQVKAETAEARAKEERERERRDREAVAQAGAYQARAERDVKEAAARLITLATARLMEEAPRTDAAWQDKVSRAIKDLE